MSEAPAPDQTPRAAVTVTPWTIPLLTGIIGLLLGALITSGIWAVVTASNATPTKAVASAAAIKAADKRYARALSDCAIETSGALRISEKTGIMRLTSGSADGSVSGLSPDILSCVVNSLGASPAVVSRLDSVDGGDIGTHRANFNGLQFVWITRDDGGIDAVVAPRIVK